MTTAVQNSSIRVDQEWVAKNQNEKTGKSFLGHFGDYAGKAYGAFRVLQVVKGVSKLWNEVVPNSSPVVKNLENGAGAAMSGLGIVRLPSVTSDAIGKVADLAKDTGVSVDRKVGLAIKDVTDAITTWIFSAMFLTGKAAFVPVAQFADLAGDTADLAISAADYKKAAACEAAASGDIKDAFTHAKNYNMLRIAKAVVSVVSALLAVMSLLAGAQLVSTVSLILISLTSALLAIRRDIYKDEGRFNLISFDKSVIV